MPGMMQQGHEQIRQKHRINMSDQFCFIIKIICQPTGSITVRLGPSAPWPRAQACQRGGCRSRSEACGPALAIRKFAEKRLEMIRSDRVHNGHHVHRDPLGATLENGTERSLSRDIVDCFLVFARRPTRPNHNPSRSHCLVLLFHLSPLSRLALSNNTYRHNATTVSL
jgi:hypothetical protein